MKKKIHLIFLAILWYIVIIFDILSMVFLSIGGQSGETKLYATIFVIERILQMIMRSYQCLKDNKQQEDNTQLFKVNMYTLLFVDFGQLIKEDIDSIKEKEEKQQKYQNAAQNNNNTNNKTKTNNKKKEEKELLIEYTYMNSLILRAFFQITFGIFINFHGMFTGLGAHGVIVTATILQLILLIIANSEVNLKKKYYQKITKLQLYFINFSDPSNREIGFVFIFLMIEFICKICFWGFFAIQGGTNGVYVLFVIEFLLGFFTELCCQCINFQDKKDEKQPWYYVVIKPCQDLQFAKRNVFYPLVAGYQLGFYFKMEECLVERLDLEEKSMKQGNIPTIYRILEIFILFIFAMVSLQKQMDLIKEYSLIGYFGAGIICFIILFFWNMFYALKKYCKKEGEGIYYFIKDPAKNIEVQELNEPQFKEQQISDKEIQLNNNKNQKQQNKNLQGKVEDKYMIDDEDHEVNSDNNQDLQLNKNNKNINLNQQKQSVQSNNLQQKKDSQKPLSQNNDGQEEEIQQQQPKQSIFDKAKNWWNEKIVQPSTKSQKNEPSTVNNQQNSNLPKKK